MPTYTVHAPPTVGGSSDPQRFVFVRDGFHFWAFVAGPLWLFVHRLWLALLGYVLIVAVLSLLSYFLVRSDTVRTLIDVLLALLVGFEAPTLRRWTYARNGWRNVGVVVGSDLEEAERRFFAQWTPAAPSTPAVVPPAPSPRQPGAAALGVIGSFPEPGLRR